ncbi:MAG: phosphonate metabolism transcriptional regulator PhnF [Alphaproteobacteria bacterium HGW-Alphaproteobacteria-2]|nr:MAG: phosphonate metabolism transcriptional regulator PhnF [Alphaproteobacteria bacterium HGW-Alphaproteobacteria-2]
MPRPTLWRSIADTLRGELAAGQYRPGDRLPTEAQLAARFGVNRHTVRQALASLAEAGHVHARRGAGVFVTARPTEYPLGRRVRFHQNLAAGGQAAERRMLSLVRRAALYRSVFPEARLPGILAALEAEASVTRALARVGVADFTRAETRLTAKLATPTQALHLRIRPGAPILRSVALNVGPGGQPVELGRTWFAGERVTLTVTPD